MENQGSRGSWMQSEEHLQFLEEQASGILKFGSGSLLKQGGFGILDENGEVSAAALDTLQNTRMTYCFSLASLNDPQYAAFADHGVKALISTIQDHDNEGWYYTVGGTASGCRKQAYIHAFVALAAATASIAKRKNASVLLEAVVDVIETRFWSEEEGVMLESYDLDWTDLEEYRGANSNMHSVEAFLALAAATEDTKWLKRALRIVERLIHTQAASNNYGVVEHFDKNWNPLKQYNIDNKGDQFRPYGITPGHGFEWSRLLLSLEADLEKAGLVAPDWLLSDATRLFDSAFASGWAADGMPGIVYTVDFDGSPVIPDRMHWVAAEAVAAAAVLYKRTGDQVYEDQYKLLWDYISSYMVDAEKGSWHHNLDELNRPTNRIWSGKPDIYHIFQSLLIPNLPIGGSMAAGLTESKNTFEVLKPL
ncbi:AGE family epimerase/isomerase [Desertivirga brevis]|uniref:AGE family epimerase/isomerase n=1 Tax=Desertivirga brevis TaxID=2810310 RepID=UPI001A9635A1|nr:AGE family epimerase/isomerase [Pedobacter sp. SYSU D00873]